jgi:hypothetical protein
VREAAGWKGTGTRRGTWRGGARPAWWWQLRPLREMETTENRPSRLAKAKMGWEARGAGPNRKLLRKRK